MYTVSMDDDDSDESEQSSPRKKKKPNMTSALGKNTVNIRVLCNLKEVADMHTARSVPVILTISHGGQHDIGKHLKTKKR